MTRKLTRSYSLSVVAPFIAILIVLTALAALAQTRGPGQSFETRHVVPVQNAAASAAANPMAPKTVGPATYNVLYNFTGGADGGTPTAGVVFDGAGNLYGTASSGGTYGRGTVYKLTPSQGGWTQTVLYSFTGVQDGDSPYGGVIFDQAGNLWGTTYQGGDPVCQCGTVFELSPSGGGWTFNLIHAFLGGSDGAYPINGLVSGGGSDRFGTTSQGGTTRDLA